MSDDDTNRQRIAGKSAIKTDAVVVSAPRRGGSPTRPPLRWPRPTDEMRPTIRQQIAFNILEADGRFSHCESATEMLKVMRVSEGRQILRALRIGRSGTSWRLAAAEHS